MIDETVMARGAVAVPDAAMVTALDRQLSDVLASVMEVDHITSGSHFFEDLGADSMVMAHFCARLRKTPELPSPSIKDVYQHPSISQLALALADRLPVPPLSDAALDRLLGDVMAQVLAEVMEVDHVTPDSDFFDDLGADSVVMTTFCDRLRSAPDLPSPSIDDVYRHTTIAGLAGSLRPRADDLATGESARLDRQPSTEHRRRPTPRAPRVPQWQFVMCGVAQFATFVVIACLAAVVAELGYEWTAAANGVADTYWRAAIVGTATFVGAAVLPIVAKWVLIGRSRPRRFLVWGPAYFRFWLVKVLVRGNPLVAFAGTPIFVWYLRALGANIGREVLFLARQVPVYADLLTIGAGSVIRKDSSLACYRADSGWIETGPVTIGRYGFVGEATVLDIHSTLGDGAQIGHSSALHAGQTVPAGERRQGTPAIHRTDVDYRAVSGTAHSTARRALYSSIQLLILVAITLPAAFGLSTALIEWSVTPASFLDVGSSPFDNWAFFRVGLIVSLVVFAGLLLARLAFVCTVPRLLARLVRPGEIYPLYGVRHLAHRVIGRTTNVNFFTNLFGDSSYIVNYLRWLGYGVTSEGQTGANFGLNVKHDNPYCISVGAGTMVADSLSIANTEYSSTSFRVVPVRIGAQSFIGNQVIYPSAATTGDDCLLASKAQVPVDGDRREHCGLLGSPSFEIPRKVDRDREFDEQKQSGALRLGLAAKNRHNLVTMGLFVASRWFITFVTVLVALGATDLFERFGYASIFVALLALPAFGVVFNVLVERAVTLFHPLEPLYCSLYDRENWRIERYWKLSWQPALFNGTPFKSVVWRLMGVRIGKRVFDDGCLMIEKTMITVGDDCVLNAASVIQPHSQEDGALKSDHVTVGNGCTLGISSLVHYGVTMGDGASLEANAFLMKGAEVTPHTEWAENPAREIRSIEPTMEPADSMPTGAADTSGTARHTGTAQRAVGRKDVMAEMTDADRDYWSDVLLAGGFTTIPRWNLDPSVGVAEHEVQVTTTLASKIARLARQLEVPASSVLLAAHAAALSAVSGERQVMTGYLVEPGRAVPCRLDTSGVSWRELILTNHRNEADLLTHAGASVDDVRERLGLTGPAFETLFDVTGTVDATDLADDVVVRVDIVRHDRRMKVRLRYRTEAFDADCAARIAGYHVAALRRMVADPDADHRLTTLISAEERRHQIEGLAGPRRELPDHPVHEVIERRVRAHPDKIAAVSGDGQLTYAEVNARANRLARALRSRGVETDTVVAVVTERNLDWLVATLAIFKAGGAYLPIEPNFPADRIATTMSRAGCRIVVTEAPSRTGLDEALNGLAGTTSVEVIDVADVDEEGHADTDLGIEVTSDQLAYIYFTSGSTGEPKGAMCEHGGMLNHIHAKIDDFQIGEGETVAQIAPQCFDISLWQLVSALLVGGRTVLIDQETILDPERFIDTIVDQGVGVLQVVPSYLEVLLSFLEQHPRELPDLHCVSVTGEALTLELVKRWFTAMPDIALANAYGLTETSDDTNHEVMRAAPEHGGVPLGRAVNNVHVYVVDEHLEPVPLGAPGEIVFSGVCVGRGYINDPERTRLAYTDDPLREGNRLYRSGDYGRWRPDGKLEFLGRRDAQIKIRGFRIEIGEIENAMMHEPEIRLGAVVVTDPGERSAQLVAFYSGDEMDSIDLAERLGRSLPHYMVPAVFHHRDSLPLTDNGKVDRKVLRTIAADIGSVEPASEAPATAAEERLAAAWATVLGVPVDQIGRSDDFFDRGGTSLTAVELVIALDNAITLTDVTRHPVLAALAPKLDDEPAATVPEVIRVAAPGLLQQLSEPNGLLVCFPHAGGHAVNFRSMATALRSSGLDVHAVELPGHDLAASHEPFEPLETVADRVADEIARLASGRIMLWGHSSGAAFAIATAIRLERLGVRVDRVFVGAQLLGDAASRRRAIERLAMSGDDEIGEWIDADGGYAQLRELDPRRAQRLTAAYRNDCVAAHRYLIAALEDPNAPRLAAPITVVVAADDPSTIDWPSRYADWRVIADDVDVVDFVDGGHLFLGRRSAETAELVHRVTGPSNGRRFSDEIHERALNSSSNGNGDGHAHAAAAGPVVTPATAREVPHLMAVDAEPDMAGWAAINGDIVRSAVAEHGSVLVRGLAVPDATDVAAIATHAGGELMQELEAFAARESHPGGAYSSTVWPANQQMCMHHEMSYRLEVPGLMIFGCLHEGTEGGAIGIADASAVLRTLPSEIVDRFVDQGWMLTRSYTDEIGLSAAQAFGTDDRAKIERYCVANAIEFEWGPDGGLRTRQLRSAVVEHPGSRQRCWFNQVAFLSEWTMKPEVHEFLVDMYGPDGLPFNTRFGNGDPITPDIVAAINDAYDANTTYVRLQAGDLLAVDNIRCAHSREPFEGPRQIVVALADSQRVADLSPTIDVGAAVL